METSGADFARACGRGRKQPPTTPELKAVFLCDAECLDAVYNDRRKIKTAHTIHSTSQRHLEGRALTHLETTMGNDGGSIAKRDELVRTKASFQKVDPELLRQSLWTVCSLSRSPLEPPVASDALGRLYNKDAIVQQLLSRHQSDPSSSKVVDPISHIRGLRDVTDLNLTPNTLYRAPSPTTSTSEHSVYPFMCPLSSKQMDGKQRFVYLPCGCVMSATGLRTTVAASQAPDESRPDHKPCPVCGKLFNAAGLAKGKQPEIGGSVVTINPSEEEEMEMREVMERHRAEQAAKKKSKARSAGEAQEDGDEAEKKRRKAERKSEQSARIAALTAELAAEKA